MRILIISLLILAVSAALLLPPVDLPEVSLCIPFLALLPLLASLATTGTQMALQSNSNAKAGQERAKYQGQLQGRVDDLNSWFDQENNMDFLNTDVARSSISGLDRQQGRQLDAINNSATAGGMTAEGQIASRGKLNETYADAIGKLLGYGTQYKQNLRGQYDYRLNSLYQPMDQLQQSRILEQGQQTQNITNAGNSLNNVIGTIDWEELLANTKGYDTGGYGIPNGPTSS